MQNAQCGICEGRFDSGRRQTLGWESRQSGQAGAVNPAVNQFENPGDCHGSVRTASQ